MKRRRVWWKCVRRTTTVEEYESATQFALTLKYRPGQFTGAPVGGVLVFEDLNQAMDFVQSNWYDMTILPVYGYDRVKMPPTASSKVHPDVKLLENHWQSKTKFGMEWPKGTRAFKKVRVLHNWEGRE